MMKKNFPSAILLMLMMIFSCNESLRVSGKKGRGCLISGSHITQESAYANYHNNVSRLRAMMCGKYTQYHSLIDTSGHFIKKDIVAVNDGKDSIVTYILPIGDAQKEGYWIYYAQCLTTLPNEPVYNVFYKLKEINRDTIISTHYRVPKNLDIDISKIVKNPNALLDSLKLDTLKWNTHQTAYYRQSLYEFTGENLRFEKLPTEADQIPQYRAYFFEVTPKHIHYGHIFFDKDKKRLGKFPRTALLEKRAMVKRTYLVR